MKIMMVCLGNICRSPLAEGILRHKIKERGLDWEVQSSGTGSWHVGQPPDPRSEKIAKKYGIDIRNQRAQKFSPHHFELFDKIYTMDSSNYNDVMEYAINENEKSKVEILMNLVEPGKNIAVPDPYFNDTLYEEVYLMLEKACEALIEREL